MLCGLLAVVSRSGRWDPTRFALTGYLGISILLSQHRSVWVSALVAGTVLCIAAIRGSKQGIFAMLPGLAAAIPIGLIAFSTASNSATLSDSAENTATLDARFSFWSDRMAVDRSTIEWLLGGFLGPSPVQLDPRFQIEAHNMYIQTITALGFVGLALLLATLVTAFPRFADAQRRTHSLMLIAVVAYGFFYTWPAWTFLLLGLSCGYREQSSVKSSLDRQRLVPKRSPPVRVAA